MSLSVQTGYLFLFLMAILTLGIAWLGLRGKQPSVDFLVTGGHRAGIGLIAVSVMMSWTWTTTLLASAEAGLWFGLTGGWHYAWGAMIPFVIFIPLALRLRRLMPAASTFTEFVRERYGATTHIIFLVFGCGVAFYVFTEQLIGAGIVLEATFGLPYRVAVVATAALVTTYIMFGGLRGSMLTDALQFFVLAIASVMILPGILQKLGGPSFLYDGLAKIATDTAHPAHNPEALDWMSHAGWRYGLAAVVIAMGQVLFEQGYYQRAIAAIHRKELYWGYILGGIFAWFPIPLAFGTVLGHGGLALGWTEGHGLSSTTEVGPQVVMETLGPLGALLFAAMTFMAAASTADTSLAGAQSLLTVDVFERFCQRKEQTSETQQLRFGYFSTLLLGACGTIVALAAQGVSLLKFDIFSGIVFAAPVGAFVLGAFWRRASASVAIFSIGVGLISGLGTWLAVEDSEINWFWGNMVSLLLPIFLMLIFTPFTHENFDFSRLKQWRPLHAVDEDTIKHQTRSSGGPPVAKKKYLPPSTSG